MRVPYSELDADDRTPTFDGMAGEAVLLEHPDHERVVLQAFEGEFPHWRKLLFGFAEKQTTSIVLNPEIVGRLAKLGSWFAGGLVWRWGGKDKVAAVEIADDTLRVSGLVMPMSWRETGPLIPDAGEPRRRVGVDDTMEPLCVHDDSPQTRESDDGDLWRCWINEHVETYRRDDDGQWWWYDPKWVDAEAPPIDDAAPDDEAGPAGEGGV